jgi:6-pyruvoyltetrahydropterin/6-carboxytetrahydropterin synthase
MIGTCTSRQAGSPGVVPLFQVWRNGTHLSGAGPLNNVEREAGVIRLPYHQESICRDSNMSYQIRIAKERMHFSAAHFTIFSATDRENLHGHNYRLAIEIEAEQQRGIGLDLDYNCIKDVATELCQSLDEYTLLPELSPFLALNKTDSHWLCRFGDEIMSLPLRDVKVLPLNNITGETLSAWFLEQLMAQLPEELRTSLTRLGAFVSSGPSQWVGSTWTKST